MFTMFLQFSFIKCEKQTEARLFADERHLIEIPHVRLSNYLRGTDLFVYFCIYSDICV